MDFVIALCVCVCDAWNVAFGFPLRIDEKCRLVMLPRLIDKRQQMANGIPK